MNTFFSDFISSYITLVITSLFIYSLGHALYSFIIVDVQSQFKVFFLKISIGVIGLVTIYAIYTTAFLSIYSGIVVTVFYYIVNNRKRFTFNSFANLTKIEFIAIDYYLINLLIITLSITYLYHFDNRLFIHQDLAFYARIGSSLYNYRIEIANTDPFIYGQIRAGLYHFFNEWFVAFFLNFSKFTSLKALLLLVVPILSTISIMGALALIDKFMPKRTNLYKNSLSFMFVLLPGLLSYSLNLLLHHSFIAQYSILQGGIEIIKDKIIVILLLLFFVCDNDRFDYKNLLALSLIPLIWPSLIPPFLGGVLMFILYSVYQKNYTICRKSFLLLIPLVYIPFHVLIFNYFYRNTLDSVPYPIEYGLMNYITDSYNHLDSILNFLLMYVFPSVLSFLFVLNYQRIFAKFGLKVTFKFKPTSNFNMLYYFILIAMILSYGLLNKLFNAGQILTNFMYPLINILLFLIFLLIIKNTHKAGFLFVVLVYFFVIINAYIFKPQIVEMDFCQRSILKVLNKQNRNIYIATDITVKQTPLYYYAKPFTQLLMFNENYKPIKLNIVDSIDCFSPKDKYEYFGSVSNQLFFRYVKSKSLFKEVDNAKIRFLNEFRIDYLLVSNDKLSLCNGYFKKLSVDSIFQLKNGMSLVKLKYNRQRILK